MHADKDPLNGLSERIIGCASTVQNILGAGFLEKSLRECTRTRIVQRLGITIRHGSAVVRQYVADLLVEGKLLIESKAVKALDDAHRAQCINYLKATGLPLCLLLNFGKPRLEVRRIINHL